MKFVFAKGTVREFLSDEGGDRHQQKQGLHRFLGRSLQELIAICMPVMGVATVLATGACFLYDPEMRALLYSALPEKYKNWLTFCVCWLEELRMIWMGVGIAIPLFQIQVIVFDLLNDSLEAIGKGFMG